MFHTLSVMLLPSSVHTEYAVTTHITGGKKSQQDTHYAHLERSQTSKNAMGGKVKEEYSTLGTERQGGEEYSALLHGKGRSSGKVMRNSNYCACH